MFLISICCYHQFSADSVPPDPLYSTEIKHVLPPIFSPFSIILTYRDNWQFKFQTSCLSYSAYVIQMYPSWVHFITCSFFIVRSCFIFSPWHLFSILYSQQFSIPRGLQHCHNPWLHYAVVTRDPLNRMSSSSYYAIMTQTVKYFISNYELYSQWYNADNYGTKCLQHITLHTTQTILGQ
jgi:hypothetical protein